MNNPHFFLEIGCEELPSGCLTLLLKALAENIEKQLVSNHIDYNPETSKTHLYSTPRRLAILIENLSESTSSNTQKISGPPLSASFDAEGKPTIAALKFAEKNGVSVEDLKKDTETNKLLFEKTDACKKTVDVLPAIIEKAIDELPIPKPMHWGNHAFTFARPVHWVTMIYNNAIVPATLLGCKTVGHTFGHRVYTTEPLSLLNKNYSEILEKKFVIPDFEKRKNNIKKQLHEKAAELNASPVLLEELLDEVTGLVEWPVVIAVPFDKRFLNLPKEVLITSMQQHQKSFALIEDGQLIPYFLTVSNIESKEPAKVIQGNQRVMQARLSDAEFFYQKDKKEPLINRREMTKNVVFQAKLGTLYDKSERFIKLAKYIVSQQPDLSINETEATLAASLSQCDLMTDMVGEFPELQGIMGYYYAFSDGHSETVATALNEQYSPRFSGDALPETSLGCILAIAERVDTLIGAFSINQKPTGSKDPFKLRRHALGLIRLLSESRNQSCSTITLNLLDLLTFAFQQYNQSINPKTVEEAHAFIIERLKAYYLEKDYTTFMIQAVLARQSMELRDFDLRIQAIKTFSTWDEATALSAGNKRVSKILEGAKTEKISDAFQEELLVEAAEKNLVTALKIKQKVLPVLLSAKQYTEALKTLSSLREPIDAFFEKVMINDPDPAIQNNRLAILKTLHQLFLSIADLSCLT